LGYSGKKRHKTYAEGKKKGADRIHKDGPSHFLALSTAKPLKKIVGSKKKGQNSSRDKETDSPTSFFYFAVRPYAPKKPEEQSLKSVEKKGRHGVKQWGGRS